MCQYIITVHLNKRFHIVFDFPKGFQILSKQMVLFGTSGEEISKIQRGFEKVKFFLRIGYISRTLFKHSLPTTTTYIPPPLWTSIWLAERGCEKVKSFLQIGYISRTLFQHSHPTTTTYIPPPLWQPHFPAATKHSTTIASTSIDTTTSSNPEVAVLLLILSGHHFHTTPIN